MKKINILYWIFTGLVIALMLMSSVSTFVPNPQGEAMIKHLGITYPLLKFLAVLKIAGIIILLIPGYPRLKEWAYAGFTFDLAGALFLGLAAGDSIVAWMFVVVGLILVFASYYFYHKRRQLKASQ